jgi:hypothetical protein
LEADNTVTRAEEAEEKLKKYDQVGLEKDQEITAMTHKVTVLDAELDKVDAQVAASKAAQEDGESSKIVNENLGRKVALLERPQLKSLPSLSLRIQLNNAALYQDHLFIISSSREATFQAAPSNPSNRLQRISVLVELR